VLPFSKEEKAGLGPENGIPGDNLGVAFGKEQNRILNALP